MQSFEADAIERHVISSPTPIGLEWPMCHPEESRLARACPGHVTHLRGQARKSRHCSICLSLKLRDDRPKRRPSARRLPFRTASRQALKGVVRGLAVRHRADDGELVHHLRQLRQMLANLETIDVGVDRLELATNLTRRVHLQIDHVLMRWTPWQEDHDHCLVIATSAL